MQHVHPLKTPNLIRDPARNRLVVRLRCPHARAASFASHHAIVKNLAMARKVLFSYGTNGEQSREAESIFLQRGILTRTNRFSQHCYILRSDQDTIGNHLSAHGTRGVAHSPDGFATLPTPGYLKYKLRGSGTEDLQHMICSRSVGVRRTPSKPIKERSLISLVCAAIEMNLHLTSPLQRYSSEGTNITHGLQSRSNTATSMTVSRSRQRGHAGG